MTTVLLVRHGRTSANTAGVLAGRSRGVALDETGVRQAADAGARIASLPIRAIVTSPLQRCRQTAQALLAARTEPVPIVVERGILECGYGEWTGRKLSELSKDPLWSTVQQQPSAVRFPGGEAMSEISARAVSTIRAWDARIAAEHGDQALWVAVSHGDVIKAILADALGMHLDAFQRILVNPASVSVVRYTSARPYVATMNSSTGDLASFAPPPAQHGRRRSKKAAATDAPVGGGLGAGTT
ncbi:MAG: histidine phosphatase family protein [Propionibacteriaceae bacterium]